MYAATGASYIGRNNIIYDNVATNSPEVYGSADLTYTCCSTVLSGTGNITDDPLFYDPEEDDFNLLAISPCIDSGDPNAPLDPDSTRADMGALYFDQSGGAMFRPSWPSDFTVTHNNADLIATLDWINPDLQLNQQPLTELLGMKIYRDGELIGNVTNVVIGEPYTWDDNTVPSAGMWDYEIVPYNSYGDGYPAEASAWIGLDTPGEAQNAVATPDPGFNLECTLTWDDPIEGGHGGYWPAGSWTGQRVYRDGVMIADLPGTNNSYVDNTIPENGFYSYGISYYNASGEGPITAASPDPVFVGPPLYEQIPYDWVEISTIGTNTSIHGDDQVGGPFNIGFSFPFYNYAQNSQVWVCSNGWMSFSAQGYGAYNNVAIPTAAVPNDMVCPFWDDLNPSQGGDIWYYHDAANSRFIVEWQNVPHYSTGGNYTFEAIFYPNGDIDLMYQELTPGTANSATVGVENQDGSEGIQVTYNGSGPLEPQPNMGIRIYSVASGTPDITIELTYVSGSPVPPSGGNIYFDVYVENADTVALNFDAWLDIEYEGGPPTTVVQRSFTNYQPGWTINRPGMYFPVPGSYAAGNYSLWGRVGGHPDVVWNESGFPFVKSGDDFAEGFIPFVPDGVPDPFDQINTGESAASDLPTEFALLPAYPNPFNPVTTLGFALPEARRVRLDVYDISGRLVAAVLDRRLDAGYHEVGFDASNLASGVYIYRIQAGDFNACGKMILMK